MDVGLPIAYEVLEEGVPVLAADGTQVGTVGHVVAAEEEDIFHGLVIKTDDGERFVAAESVGSLHEHAAELKLAAGAIAGLPTPHGGAPAWRVVEPGTKPNPWKRFTELLRLHDPAKDNWSEED